MAPKIGVASKSGIATMVENVKDPCRICGEIIGTAEAIWTGLSAEGESGTAHKVCWDKHIPREQWAYPRDAIEMS